MAARLMPAAQRAAAGYEHLAACAGAPVLDPGRDRGARFGYGLEIVPVGLAQHFRAEVPWGVPGGLGPSTFRAGARPPRKR
jgi:hypothetical protein